MNETTASSWTDNHSLTGKVVLVTGGSRGIGAAIATAAGRAGADVAIGYKDQPYSAQAVVREIEAMGRHSVSFQADISDPAKARGMIADVEAAFGRIDGLVNNAGIMPSSPLLEMSDEEWSSVLHTNLFGAYYCSSAALSGMVQRGEGSIVMISSRLGQIGFPELAHYSAAKAGLLGLTKSMAREFGPQGVRVNAVAPGFTVTDMTRDLVETESGRRRLAELPSRRFPEPQDVASAVLFLLSDAAALFHGQTLNPNGGGFMQ
ncbi:MAG: 3-oxoacyl-ACP reductase FabG [Acidimicrobiia bacterium]|nr:3-oxoacyl-ACP reductase FabG [Acidimicrobiia bacterium]